MYPRVEYELLREHGPRPLGRIIRVVSEAPGLSGGACFLPGTWFGRGVGEHLERPFFARLLAGDRDRIFPGQAAQTDVVPRVLEGGTQPAEGERAKAGRLEEAGDRRAGRRGRAERV